MSPTSVPSIRVVRKNDAALREDGDYVLYWMIAARRTRWNFGLQQAADHARALDRPLLVFEPLRSDYPHASDRFHRFVLDGMRDHRDELAGLPVTYYPYVEPEHGADRGLLAALAERACVVVTDDAPIRFLRGFVDAAAETLEVRLEAVDSYGVVPLRLPGKKFVRAFDFRRWVEKHRDEVLADPPKRYPVSRIDLPELGGVPREVAQRWPAATDALLDGEAGLEDLPIDHDVAPTDREGGTQGGERALKTFVAERLKAYHDERNEPGASSGLSPYLHFGHLGAHQVFQAVEDARGGESADDFLDQLVTWREVCANFCHHVANADSYASLPDWARKTLEEHAGDERPSTYTRKQFDEAKTHDELWNAAQRQLRVEGRIENYLRMVWGKKILHWSKSPKAAWNTMVELNDRYALDGRDPNSYGGIGWVMGRFDRAWGPEREVFGKVRYMTVRNTYKKIDLDEYLERWGEQATLFS